MVKKVLEDQLSQIQQEKNAAKEQKKKEATELRDSIRQYEEEEFQKWQQHKEQQAKTKQMYSQQASQIHTVLVSIRASHSDKSRHTKACIVSAQCAARNNPQQAAYLQVRCCCLQSIMYFSKGDISVKLSLCNAYTVLLTIGFVHHLPAACMSRICACHEPSCHLEV